MSFSCPELLFLDLSIVQALMEIFSSNFGLHFLTDMVLTIVVSPGLVFYVYILQLGDLFYRVTLNSIYVLMTHILTSLTHSYLLNVKLNWMLLNWMLTNWMLTHSLIFPFVYLICISKFKCLIGNPRCSSATSQSPVPPSVFSIRVNGTNTHPVVQANGLKVNPSPHALNTIH